MAWVGILGGSTKAYHKILLGSQPSRNGLFLVQWETLLEDSKTQSHRKRHLESYTDLQWHNGILIRIYAAHTYTHTHMERSERERQRSQLTILLKNYTSLRFSPSLRAVNYMIFSMPCTSKCSISNRKKYICCQEILAGGYISLKADETIVEFIKLTSHFYPAWCLRNESSDGMHHC